ncbi:MAG: polyprenyl synthetase family protein [Chloroflexi bacterium]|nr:polyprenyl synthetase family protein [Chloroflexota bacterium]
MDSAQTLNSFFNVFIPRVEGEIRRIIDSTPFTPTPGAFLTMLHYHLGFANTDGSLAQVYSGKRIRPMLTLLACQACGGSADDALPAAAAIELLHNFSLIHDDIEDRDELRRGRPTLWKLWGEAQAINAGDAMFALAHRALERMVELGSGAGRVVRALLTFDNAAVALTVGQHLDLSFETRTDVTVAEYMAMIRGKTGALTQAACEIGAILAGAQPGPVAALAGFGAWLGIAFQLQDDVLGIWGNPKLTGKQDSDLNHHKKTLPVLYAAERDARVRELYFARRSQRDEDIATLRELIEACGAREYTEQQARDAYARSLAALDTSGVSGAAATMLRELAHSLVGRAA